MADPLEDAKLRLEWAKSQIRDLETAVNRFRASNPYRIVVDRDSKPGHELYKAFPAADIPKEFVRMVSVGSQDLKSVLDYAVYAVALQAGVDDDRIMFPIGKTRESFEHQIKHLKIERASIDLANIIRSINPYKGANALLFSLHQLNRGDKHRKLATVGMTPHNAGLRIYEGVVGRMQFMPRQPAGWQFLKDGFVIFELQGRIQGDLEFSVQVALSELEGFERKPVVAVFQEMMRAVEGFLLLVENRFFR